MITLDIWIRESTSTSVLLDLHVSSHSRARVHTHANNLLLYLYLHFPFSSQSQALRSSINRGTEIHSILLRRSTALQPASQRRGRVPPFRRTGIPQSLKVPCACGVACVKHLSGSHASLRQSCTGEAYRITPRDPLCKWESRGELS